MFINCTLQQAIARIQAGGTLWSLDTFEGFELHNPGSWSKRAIRSWLVRRHHDAADFAQVECPRFQVDLPKA